MIAISVEGLGQRIDPEIERLREEAGRLREQREETARIRERTSRLRQETARVREETARIREEAAGRLLRPPTSPRIPLFVLGIGAILLLSTVIDGIRRRRRADTTG